MEKTARLMQDKPLHARHVLKEPRQGIDGIIGSSSIIRRDLSSEVKCEAEDSAPLVDSIEERKCGIFQELLIARYRVALKTTRSSAI